MIVVFKVIVVSVIAVILKYSCPVSPYGKLVATAISSPTAHPVAAKTYIVESPTLAGAANYVHTVSG